MCLRLGVFAVRTVAPALLVAGKGGGKRDRKDDRSLVH